MSAWNERDIPLQTGRLAIVTGGNSGIGLFTALGLARAGAEVIIATRSEAKAVEAIRQVRASVPSASLRFEALDLASLRSVRAFVQRVGRLPKIDLLVNNAAVMYIPTRELTEDGFERQFGTNYLGPFALTLGLLPTLLRSPHPRVTTVSSGAANMGLKRIKFEDLEWDRGYRHYPAYCQSKLADLMFAIELGQRSARVGIPLTSNAAHPGAARTNLLSSGRGRPPNLGARILIRIIGQSAAGGALSVLRASTDPSATSGSYFGPSRLGGSRGPPAPVGVPAPALDAGARSRLWEISERLTGAHWDPTQPPVPFEN